jgi:hypothetical protein
MDWICQDRPDGCLCWTWWNGSSPRMA